MVVLSAVCTAMEARPFLLIFLTTHLAVRRIWHLPESGASPRLRDRNRLEGCRGFNGPYPSAPLDERYSIVEPARLVALVAPAERWCARDPGMRWGSALFKTVTEGQGG
ncbi:hypothetical protein GCM10022384_60670 [Streptomyces marokkonensis]|uniref:Uncharacterized protein n=1 Tax=Streptomyces marokkonensis TaxID=324855 RepID=A0ABP7S3U4_9ACTN